jgi:8-oxo-dGTP pyrophosphatase MutT (NUDIX family)
MEQMYKVFNFRMPIIIHSEYFYDGGCRNSLYLRIDDPEEWDYLSQNTWKNDGIELLSLYTDDLNKAWGKFKSYFQLVQAAGGIIENEHGELLVIKRNGILDLPKGHIEKGELAKEAALREVSEECGLKNQTIKSSNPKVTYHIYQQGSQWILKKTFWFSMNASVDEILIPETNEGIESVQWMDKRAILMDKNKFYPSLLDLFV